MSNTIVDTLTLLDSWYKEPNNSIERTNLLSKFALLELCGWIEGYFDNVILEIDGQFLNKNEWVQKNVINPTNGFRYEKDVRSMISRLVGEIFVLRKYLTINYRAVAIALIVGTNLFVHRPTGRKIKVRREWHLLKLKTPDAARINIFHHPLKAG